jgi:DNA polymerase III delta prime subunit
MFKDIIGHENIKNELIQIKNNLPKSIIFNGPKNVGKVHTAFNFIDELYKGSFRHRLYKHPDVILFETDTKVFKIGLVREVREAVATTPLELDKKYLILKNVDLMNKDAANSCLKMLEDVSENIQFILTSENIDNVLDTIVSRSTVLNFYPVENIEKHLPNLSSLEVKLMGGCIGNKNLFEEINIEQVNESVETFIKNIFDLKYDQIIDWCESKKEIDKNLLLNCMRNSCLKLVEENKSDKNNKLLKNLNNFKDTLMSTVNLDIHFKNMLIQTKYENG